MAARCAVHRPLVALVLALGAAVASAATSGAQQPPGIALPTPGSIGAGAPDPTALLGPDRPGETVSRLPGPLTDREVVRIGLAPDGTVRSVVVDQTLTIEGVGDFDLTLPGPALDVDAPPDQSPQPGLRRGAVVLRGFSAGREELRLRVTLDPAVEALRLPVQVTREAAGLVVRNTTITPVALADGVPDAGALRAAVSAVRDALGGGRAPLAGRDGIPAVVPGTPTGMVDRPVGITLDVDGSRVAPGGAVTVAPEDLPVRVAAALPDVGQLGAGSLVELQTVLAQVLRRGDLASYLGTAADEVDAATVFEVALAPPRATRRAAGPVDDDARPGAIALAAVAALLLVAATTAVWRRA